MFQSKHPTQRGKLFVDRQVQGRLISRILIHWSVFFALTTMIGFFLNFLGGGGSATLWSAIRAQIPLAIVMLVLLPWFIHDSIRISNRFVGPIIRLRRFMRDLTNNDSCGELGFRTGDNWNELATEFNELRKQHILLRDALRVRNSGEQKEDKHAAWNGSNRHQVTENAPLPSRASMHS